ncbi:hypothetical protein CLV60_12259 [Dyadobacter jiangsuensis]|uniref:Uncharacterized protein n=1 Tax=Dyadobacter jiangsuensis TaxID=1591085 RepID=A0A2P8FI95_9BACT|nr:hypothetical protein CLV60_12259 [Dyadobacter jiangsuensis]
MRPLHIVCMNDFNDSLDSFSVILVDTLGEKLIFYYPVYSFGKRIIVRATTLGHAYGDIFFFEDIHVLGRTVLDSSIRMMDQKVRRVICS